MSDVERLAETLWDYHRLHQSLGPADAMLVLGGHDVRVAEYAAVLLRRGLAPFAVVSGGVAHMDDLLRTGWSGTEASQFAAVMLKEGIPSDQIILEERATNTGENFLFGRPLIEMRVPECRHILVVTKPYMERRAFATGSKQWPEAELTVASPPLSFNEYVDGPIRRDDVINLMVGDYQRIKCYGKEGFQIPQEVTPAAEDAYRQLIELGFTKHMLKNQKPA